MTEPGVRTVDAAEPRPALIPAPAPPVDPPREDGGRVRRRPALSPSRAGDFRTCPLLYRYRAVDKLPEHPSHAQLRGTLVHAVLERLFALPPLDRTPAAAAALVGPAWVDLVIGWPGIADALFGPRDVEEETFGFADWLASAHELVAAYFTVEDPRAVTADAVELLVESDLGEGLMLRGVVDRVDVLPDGGLRVVDYKTGRAPHEFGEASAMFQLKFYALALLHERGAVPGELRLLYLRSGEWLSYSPDRGELERFTRVLAALWDAIREAGRTGEFLPRRGSACRFCAHKAICPEWGGTPPPYPGWPEADPGTDLAADGA
ncbi:exonuclease RecB [Pseudonocardia sulfidoxydans NBRC 16205]|uniref:Exonuclease RecB n=1 Tax=Pseudonocardia sulfidoxydans NBRC 16205 TaxID=1223511 RepID=A0A511D946_9PSEU|nr:exonuclease RecB [Pseudonocardia sulfidoxydans NBRC 16205]